MIPEEIKQQLIANPQPVPFKLSDHETITDWNKFIEGHFAIINNAKEKVARPYRERIINAYKLINP